MARKSRTWKTVKTSKTQHTFYSMSFDGKDTQNTNEETANYTQLFAISWKLFASSDNNNNNYDAYASSSFDFLLLLPSNSFASAEHIVIGVMELASYSDAHHDHSRTSPPIHYEFVVFTTHIKGMRAYANPNRNGSSTMIARRAQNVQNNHVH